jgi:hypothetical protein
MREKRAIKRTYTVGSYMKQRAVEETEGYGRTEVEEETCGHRGENCRKGGRGP